MIYSKRRTKRMEILPLYELIQLCRQDNVEAKQEWKRRWEADFPHMAPTQKVDNVSLEENKIYIVKNQQLVAIEPPPDGFGDQTFVWLNGEVDRVDVRSTKKIRTNKGS
jgi:hypothetical protein